MDTGLRVGKVSFIFTNDPIGALRASAAAGYNIESIASAAASYGADRDLAALSNLGSSLDAQGTSSVFSMEKGMASDIARIAAET